MDFSREPHLTDPRATALARDLGAEFVRCFAAVADVFEREGRGVGLSPALVADRLEQAITDRLLEMTHVFDPGDLDTTVLHLAEGIDNLGSGVALDPLDVPAFRSTAALAPEQLLLDPPVLSAEVESVRAELLCEGLVVVDEREGPGGRCLELAGRSEAQSREIAARVVPGLSVDWIGPTQRCIDATRCTAWREKGDRLIRVWVRVAEDEHVDEVTVAEDVSRVVVLATVCRPAAGARGQRHELPHRVWLREPIGDRDVIDAFSGATLERS